jgi:hypothetical protein
MRSALYQRAGYVDAFRDAAKYLDLPVPAAPKPSEGGTLRDVFPNGGPVRRRRPFR